jgi:hypothetical protein
MRRLLADSMSFRNVAAVSVQVADDDPNHVLCTHGRPYTRRRFRSRWLALMDEIIEARPLFRLRRG